MPIPTTLNNIKDETFLKLIIMAYIILKWIFKKWDGQAWTGLICLTMGQGSRLL
jgi:hypothetical protein